MPVQRKSRAFTLVELLTVIGIIAVLAALLFPVFATARGKAREITCVSNLRQIGMAIKMYTQDYDELYPWAVDATDRYTPQIWSQYPEFQAQIPYMPFIHEALQPYIKSKELFHCPADSGYDVEDSNGMPLDARPTSYQKFGTSYNYRTEIAFRRAGEGSIREPSSVNVLFDAAGRWHGGVLFDQLRYNVLHADGHAKNLSRDQLQMLWAAPL
jgi:prepilin-type N-terminal cleavage/methylation domain-containing protein/prepilin-type processing-associated H-X9-DG protein